MASGRVPCYNDTFGVIAVFKYKVVNGREGGASIIERGRPPMLGRQPIGDGDQHGGQVLHRRRHEAQPFEPAMGPGAAVQKDQYRRVFCLFGLVDLELLTRQRPIRYTGGGLDLDCAAEDFDAMRIGGGLGGGHGHGGGGWLEVAHALESIDVWADAATILKDSVRDVDAADRRMVSWRLSRPVGAISVRHAVNAEYQAMQRIGFVGMGRMGMAMARRLSGAGLAVTAWNRSPKVFPEGVEPAASLQDLVERSDVVLSMLLDDDATLQVHAQMLERGDAQGKIFVEMGTVRLDTVHELAGMVGAANGVFVEAPVVGTVGPAIQGQLLTLAAGDEKVVESLQDIWQAYSRRVVYCGALGRGMAMKHCVNNLLSVYFAGLAEALGAGSAAGLSLEQMLDVILDTAAALPALAPKAEVIKGAEPPVAFSVAGAVKDLGVITSSGIENGLPMYVTQQALRVFGETAQAGAADQDLAVVARHYIRSDR